MKTARVPKHQLLCNLMLCMGLAGVAILSSGSAQAQEPSRMARDQPEVNESGHVMRLDLPKAIELALKNNPGLKAVEGDIAVAAAQRDQAASGHWPSLWAGVGWTEYRRNQRLYSATSPGDPAVISHHMLGGDVFLSFPLYSGGRISGNLEAAEFTEDSARDTGQWTRVDLVFRVTATYYSILAQRRLIAALASAEEAMARNIERLEALVAERKAAPLDRQRMDVRLAAIKQRRIQEEAALEVKQLSLLSLIGITGDAGTTRIEGELGDPSVTPPVSSESLVQEAMARRADVHASRSAVKAQERRIKVARAGQYPSVLVQGSYGLRWGLWPSEQPEGLDAWADVGQVGLYLDVPIFEGGRVTAEVREQQARLSAMRERLQQTELQVRLEVEATVLDYHAAMQRVALSDATIDLATEAFRVESEKYAEGRSTISDVLSAQSELLDAEAGRASALADVNIAAAALRRAIGEIK